MRKVVVGVVVLAIVVGFIFWKYAPNFSSSTTTVEDVTLIYWGLWESDSDIRPAINAYLMTAKENVSAHPKKILVPVASNQYGKFLSQKVVYR